MSEQPPPQLLGALPRSRPHRRSDKRPARPLVPSGAGAAAAEGEAAVAAGDSAGSGGPLAGGGLPLIGIAGKLLSFGVALGARLLPRLPGR
jgi:hypothetical protein